MTYDQEAPPLEARIQMAQLAMVVLQTLLLCLIAWGVWDKKCSVRVECREEKA